MNVQLATIIESDEVADIRVMYFLLVPGFSMLAFTSAIEPLRLANELSKQPLFDWEMISADGAPVICSNGIEFPVSGSIEDVHHCWALVVCGGRNSHLGHNKDVDSCLRRLRFGGSKIGALSDGAYILARAGLLRHSKCTIHWKCLDGFSEMYPDIDINDEIFHIDGNLFTCSGGTTSLDLMLKLIELECDDDIATAIAEHFMHMRVREPHTRQRIPKSVCYNRASEKLSIAVGLMESHLEDTCSITSICEIVGVSSRQLQRLFATYTGQTPSQYYMRLRLQRARDLLASTNLRVTEIAVASGFCSMSHFSKCYRDFVGTTPRRDRLNVGFCRNA